MNCDHCNESTPVTTTLNHVSFEGGLISKMVGSYTVCLDCRNELEDNDSVTWRGK